LRWDRSATEGIRVTIDVKPGDEPTTIEPKEIEGSETVKMEGCA